MKRYIFGLALLMSGLISSAFADNVKLEFKCSEDSMLKVKGTVLHDPYTNDLGWDSLWQIERQKDCEFYADKLNSALGETLISRDHQIFFFCQDTHIGLVNSEHTVDQILFPIYGTSEDNRRHVCSHLATWGLNKVIRKFHKY